MEVSNTFPAAIIQHESSARTASPHFLTNIRFSGILIFRKIDYPSLTPPLFHDPLIFIEWSIWNPMTILMWPTIWKNPTPQKQNFLFFSFKEHPLDLLEAIPLGIAGYINYPFSLRNICKFFLNFSP